MLRIAALTTPSSRTSIAQRIRFVKRGPEKVFCKNANTVSQNVIMERAATTQQPYCAIQTAGKCTLARDEIQGRLAALDDIHHASRGDDIPSLREPPKLVKLASGNPYAAWIKNPRSEERGFFGKLHRKSYHFYI